MPDNPPVHMFWLGSATPPWAESNQRLWKTEIGRALQFWDDARVQSNALLPAFDECWPPAMAVDLLRVAVISQQSGWYIDADIAPTKPRLFETDSVILVREDPRRFCNGIFYAPKGHPFLEVWQREILRSITEANQELGDVARISGPHALSRAIYLYALEAGAQVSRTHLQTLPWGLVGFTNSRDVGTVWSKFFRRHSWVVHVAATSWLPNHHSSKAGNFLYELRRTRVGLGLEILRQLLTAPSVPPIRRSDWYLIANMDNTVLDSRTDWTEFWIEISDPELLVDAVRTLSVGGIVSHCPAIADTLNMAGWKRIGATRWARPRVTRLVSDLHGLD